VLGFFLLGKNPVIVDVFLNFDWDHDLGVLLVEFIVVLLRIEDGQDRGILGALAIEVISIVLLFSILFALLSFLLFLVALVILDFLSVVLVELLLHVHQVLLLVDLTLLGRGDLSLTVFRTSLIESLSADDVLSTGSDCKLEPLEKLAKSNVVGIDFVLLQAFKHSLDVVNGMECLEVLRLSAQCSVLLHQAGHLTVNEHLCLLPEQETRVRTANLVAFFTEKEEKSLDNSRHFEHSEGLDVDQVFLPLILLNEKFGSARNLLLFGLKIAQLFISLDVFALLESLFNLLLHLFDKDGVILILISHIEAHEFELSVTVESKVVTLFLFPRFLEALDGLEGESLLLVGELSVLTHRVQTNNILFFDSLEGGVFNSFPGTLFLGLVLLTSSGLLLTDLVLLFLVSNLLLFLLLVSLSHIEVVGNGGLECVVMEATFIDERNGNVGTQAGYLLELHALLADDLVNVDVVFEGVQDVVCLCLHDGLTVLIKLRLIFFANTLISEDLVGDSGRVVNGIDHELVIGSSMREFDDLLSLLVHVILIVGVIVDWLLGENQLSKVSSSGLGVFAELVDKTLQVVFKVVRLVNLDPKVFLGNHFGIGLHLFSCYNLIVHIDFLLVSISELSNLLIVKSFLGGDLLDFGVVEEVLGKVLHGVVRLGLVGLGEGLAED